MSRGGVKEVVPKAGLQFQEQTLHPVLCKPRLLPLKSVTLEKLEKMQRDAQEKVWEMEMEPENATQEDETPISKDAENGQGGQADIWTADDDPPQEEPEDATSPRL